MAIFGVGAHWDGRDKINDFIHHNVAVGLNRSAVVADRCNDRGVIIMPPLRDD